MLSRFLTLREQMILGGLAAALLIGTGTLLWFRSAAAPTPTPQAIPAHLPPVALPAPTPATPPTAPSVPKENTQPTPLPPPLPAAPRIAVAVQGAVHRPGMYYFDTGQRINDLLLAAGGARDTADLSDINLSAHLIDGTTLIVPAQPAPASSTAQRAHAGNPAPHFAARPPNPPQYTISGWTPQHAPAPATPGPAAPPPTPPPTEGTPLATRINLNTATQTELESLPGIGPAFATRIIAFRQQQPFEHIEDLKRVSGIGEKRFAAIKDLITVN